MYQKLYQPVGSSQCTFKPKAKPSATPSQQPDSTLFPCGYKIQYTAKATFNLSPFPLSPPPPVKQEKERGKLLAGLRPNKQLSGIFIGSPAVLTQMEEPDFALPFHT